MFLCPRGGGTWPTTSASWARTITSLTSCAQVRLVFQSWFLKLNPINNWFTLTSGRSRQLYTISDNFRLSSLCPKENWLEVTVELKSFLAHPTRVIALWRKLFRNLELNIWPKLWPWCPISQARIISDKKYLDIPSFIVSLSIYIWIWVEKVICS